MVKYPPIQPKDRFGLLTVVKAVDPYFYDYTDKGGLKSKIKFGRWLCRCDCGNEMIVYQNNLRKVRRHSCKKCLGIGETNAQWTGYGEISGKKWYKIQTGATKGYTQKEFTITIQEAWDLFVKQGRKCALTGLPLEFPSQGSLSNGSASLDRINSLKGYITGNIQWVYKTINTMKWDDNEDDFIMFCHLVAAHNPPKK
jgi:hypothetical protein